MLPKATSVAKSAMEASRTILLRRMAGMGAPGEVDSAAQPRPARGSQTFQIQFGEVGEPGLFEAAGDAGEAFEVFQLAVGLLQAIQGPAVVGHARKRLLEGQG